MARQLHCSRSMRLAITVLCVFYASLAAAVSSQEPLKLEKTRYSPGQSIPVTCLNRSIDTGEHITDSQNRLSYIPFWTCNETGRPLELSFGIEKETNCTIDFISDPMFHLLEFYIHNDAPLTCRIPLRPLPAPLSSSGLLENEQEGALGSQSTAYAPLVIALGGTLQLSHLHIANRLNLLVHALPKSIEPGVIDAATAYSVSSHSERSQQKVIIGDSLTLQFSVRWYPSPILPPGWTGYGGHIYFSTILYCCLSAGAATAVCVAWFRGVELPRRLKNWRGSKTDALPRYSGYGYGVGTGAAPMSGGGMNGIGVNGFGFGTGGGTGKRD